MNSWAWNRIWRDGVIPDFLFQMLLEIFPCGAIRCYLGSFRQKGRGRHLPGKKHLSKGLVVEIAELLEGGVEGWRIVEVM